MKALIEIATRLNSTTVCRRPGLPQFAGVGYLKCFIVLSSIMKGKLKAFLCFDIFQSKWYQNALIGVPDDKSKVREDCLY